MSRTSTYKVSIDDLSKKIIDNGSNVIKDASRVYLGLMEKNIRKFTKTGGLLSSWKIEILNDKHSQIYSNKPYARIRDKGGEIRITAKMRNFAWHMWYKTKNKMWRSIAITKKKYIIQKGSDYSNVDLNTIKLAIENKY